MSSGSACTARTRDRRIRSRQALTTIRCSQVVTRGVATERLGPAERGDHRVLEGVGGVRRVAGRAQGDRPEPVAVPAEQGAERLRVTGDVRGQQRTVVLGERPDPRRGPRSLGVPWGGHERTVISAIAPRNPPSTGGSEVSHTTR